MAIYFTSDLEGNYGGLEHILEGGSFKKDDKLIIAGDWFDKVWFQGQGLNFGIEMLKKVVEKGVTIYFLPGNNDPKSGLLKRIIKENLPNEILNKIKIIDQPKLENIDGIKVLFWGPGAGPGGEEEGAIAVNPALAPHYNGAIFYERAKKLIEKLPKDSEVIIVAHMPPYLGDGEVTNTNLDYVINSNVVGREGGHVGCKYLRKFIKEFKDKYKLKVVFGHVHEGAGEGKLGNAELYNIAGKIKRIDDLKIEEKVTQTKKETNKIPLSNYLTPYVAPIKTIYNSLKEFYNTGKNIAYNIAKDTKKIVKEVGNVYYKGFKSFFSGYINLFKGIANFFYKTKNPVPA